MQRNSCCKSSAEKMAELFALDSSAQPQQTTAGNIDGFVFNDIAHPLQFFKSGCKICIPKSDKIKISELVGVEYSLSYCFCFTAIFSKFEKYGSFLTAQIGQDFSCVIAASVIDKINFICGCPVINSAKVFVSSRFPSL